MISNHSRNTIALLLGLLAAGGVIAAGADLGNTQKQATNWVAIAMFAGFVAITLGITKWAAAKTKSAADFYTAGGGITGFRTVSRLPATTCRRRRSSVSRASSSPTASTA
jgi:cation/acetate symporter